MSIRMPMGILLSTSRALCAIMIKLASSTVYMTQTLYSSASWSQNYYNPWSVTHKLSKNYTGTSPVASSNVRSC